MNINIPVLPVKNVLEAHNIINAIFSHFQFFESQYKINNPIAAPNACIMDSAAPPLEVNPNALYKLSELQFAPKIIYVSNSVLKSGLKNPYSRIND